MSSKSVKYCEFRIRKVYSGALHQKNCVYTAYTAKANLTTQACLPLDSKSKLELNLRKVKSE